MCVLVYLVGVDMENSLFFCQNDDRKQLPFYYDADFQLQSDVSEHLSGEAWWWKKQDIIRKCVYNEAPYVPRMLETESCLIMSHDQIMSSMLQLLLGVTS